MITVLLIEDNPGDARLVRELLAEAGGDGFRVCHADCLSAGLERMAEGRIDVVLLDLSLPDSIGLDTFARAYAQASSLPIVVLTGLDDEEVASQAMRMGAQDYLSKGEMSSSLLARSLRYAIDRKQAEAEKERLLEENRRQREFLQKLVDDAPVAIAVLSGPEYRYTLANPQYMQQLAWDRGQLVGWALHEVWPEIAAGVVPILDEIRRTGRPYSAIDQPYRFQRDSGIRERYLSLNLVPLFDDKGEVESILVLLQDTTERVGTRRMMEEAAARVQEANSQLIHNALGLKAIIEEMPMAVLVTDELARVTMANRHVERLSGRPVPYGQDYSTYAFREILHPDGSPWEPRDLPLTRSALDGERCSNVELLIRRPSGQVVPVLVSAAPLRDDEDRVTGAVGVFQDITELKELDQRKDEFLSIAAHELRTPMTAMKGYAQLLQRRADELPDADRWIRPLHTIDQQVERMTNLVERLLDVSRIQMGRLELKPEPMDLVRLIEEATAEARMTANQHDIELEAAQPEIQGCWDRARLQQVLTNLLSNAAKYSPHGGRIQVKVAGDQAEAVVSVKDEGTGIPQAALPHIFDRSYRSAEATHSNISGLGLGLYIAKGIIDAHGGRIWVESVEGQGSTFYVSLPF